jgi:hypothetical protein
MRGHPARDTFRGRSSRPHLEWRLEAFQHQGNAPVELEAYVSGLFDTNSYQPHHGTERQEDPC